jgi:hypothetical protein
MSAICECWRCGGQLRGPPGLSVLMPLPGRVPSADREFSRALPRHKKIRSLLCHRGFHGWTCQGPELNFYVTRLPQNKNAGRPFGARHRLHRPSPAPARPAARAQLPSPHGDRARPRAGRHASQEKPGTGPHDTAGRHGTRRRGPHARAGISCRTSVQFRGLIDLDRGPQKVKSTPARRASANAPQPKTALRGCLPIGKWPSCLIVAM